MGGEGWYRKHFRLLRANQHVEVRFDGVYQDADFWLNGTHLGFHPYGYTSFFYDLTPYLNPRGTNVLVVRVRNLGENSRWYSGSGIIRYVWLNVTAPLHIPHGGGPGNHPNRERCLRHRSCQGFGSERQRGCHR